MFRSQGKESTSNDDCWVVPCELCYLLETKHFCNPTRIRAQMRANRKKDLGSPGFAFGAPRASPEEAASTAGAQFRADQRRAGAQCSELAAGDFAGETRHRAVTAAHIVARGVPSPQALTLLAQAVELYGIAEAQQATAQAAFAEQRAALDAQRAALALALALEDATP